MISSLLERAFLTQWTEYRVSSRWVAGLNPAEGVSLSENMENWPSGWMRRFAKPLSHVSGSVSSNLTFSIESASWLRVRRHRKFDSFTWQWWFESTYSLFPVSQEYTVVWTNGKKSQSNWNKHQGSNLLVNADRRIEPTLIRTVSKPHLLIENRFFCFQVRFPGWGIAWGLVWFG